MNKNKVGHFKKMICVGKESSDVKASISIIELSEQDRVNNLWFIYSICTCDATLDTTFINDRNIRNDKYNNFLFLVIINFIIFYF